jgi:hypothetical protein
MSGVIHADARTLDDRHPPPAACIGNIEVVAQEIVPVEALVDMHRPAQQSWSLGSTLDIPYWFDRAQ